MAPLHHSFNGKKVLVTGGGRGIGHAIVTKFYNDGAHVFVIDRDAKLLETLKKDMPKVTTVCLDLTDWDATKKAVEAMAPLDHLVNNAGIVGDAPLLEVTPETFDKVFAVNVKAALNVSQAFVKGIMNNKAEGGTIVNVSSLGDRIAFWGAPCYGASKAALTMLTKSMALEYGQLNIGIRANCVNPTFIATDLVMAIQPRVIEAASEIMQRVIIKNRPLQATDVADSVLFLSSPLSSMITGESLLIDSGTRAF